MLSKNKLPFYWLCTSILRLEHFWIFNWQKAGSQQTLLTFFPGDQGWAVDNMLVFTYCVTDRGRFKYVPSFGAPIYAVKFAKSKPSFLNQNLLLPAF